MAKKKIKKLLKGAAKIALPAAALAMMMRGGKDSNKFFIPPPLKKVSYCAN